MLFRKYFPIAHSWLRFVKLSPEENEEYAGSLASGKNPDVLGKFFGLPWDTLQDLDGRSTRNGGTELAYVNPNI